MPTPDVIAYAVYPAGPVFLRADVATAEVPDARDLGDLLASTAPGDPERAEALPLVGELLIFLERAGARHPDLNVKNILIGRDDEARQALVIDVDRVVFDRPLSPSVTAANQARLLRSIRRGVERRGVRMRDDDYRLLFARARTSGVVA